MGRKPILTIAAGLIVTATLRANDVSYSCVDCCTGCGETACDRCCGDACCASCDNGLQFYGWVNGGIIGNTGSPGSRFNGPYNAVDRSNEAMLNQFYFVAEQTLPNYGTGLGGRIDLLYGEDFFLAESIGIEKRPDGSSHWNPQYYGFAFPQAYVSAGSRDMNVQVGHFYSVVGYEGVMAPDNFFYSKSYSYQFAGPFTHWGAQLNWRPSQAWTVQAGLHNGWDAFDRPTDDVGFVGRIRYDSDYSGAWTSFAITTGGEGNNAAGVALTPDFTNRTRYSWLVGIPLTCRADYVFHHWLGFQEAGAADGSRADWYGIDQYLTWRMDNCWAAAFRFEWFRDEEGTRVGLNRTRNPNNAPFVGDFYSLTFGMNWTPTTRLTVRPEIRADWYDGPGANPFQDGADDAQLMLGCDGIVRF